MENWVVEDWGLPHVARSPPSRLPLRAREGAQVDHASRIYSRPGGEAGPPPTRLEVAKRTIARIALRIGSLNFDHASITVDSSC